MRQPFCESSDQFGGIRPTASAQRAALEAIGVSGAALEALIRETAPDRHRLRVQAAKEAALAYVAALPTEECDGIPPEHLAAAICWADFAGHGGRDGVEGFSTERHPAFAECGTGRKQARDGDAWSAAIAEAAVVLLGERHAMRLQFFASEEFFLWAQVERKDPDDTDRPAVDAYDLVSSFPLDTGTLAYAGRTIAREGLRRACRMDRRGTHLGRLPIFLPSRWSREWEEKIADVRLWADVVNRLAETIFAAGIAFGPDAKGWVGEQPSGQGVRNFFVRRLEDGQYEATCEEVAEVMYGGILGPDGAIPVEPRVFQDPTTGHGGSVIEAVNDLFDNHGWGGFRPAPEAPEETESEVDHVGTRSP